ncbi:MAG: hypothetical protein IPK88_12970 [Saprospiraceae bacterium]|nr:hypothetical protein [Candidatus Defluviibacterium haderslevense]
MDHQINLIKMISKLNGLSFLHSKHGSFFRKKGGASGTQIKTDPAFARTREIMQEFGEINRAGKWIRNAFKLVTGTESDDKMVNRLVKHLALVIKTDTTHLRGDRKVGFGLLTSDGKAHLLQFNFNIKSMLYGVLKTDYHVDVKSGVVSIPDFVPQKELYFPDTATHCSLESAWSEIDFASGKFNASISPAVSLARDLTKHNVVLTPAQPPTGNGILLVVLKVSFLKEDNGRFYPAKYGAKNAMEIVAIK